MRCGPTVLLVKDNEDQREAMATLLTAQGYGTCTAADGASALELLQRHPECDLIVLDWRLPDMDGAAVLEAVHAAPHLAALPIIVLSANGLTPSRVRAAGGMALLQQRHDPDVLLAFIAQQLDR